MAIVKYRDVVQDAAGNAVVGATVTILDTGTATPSTIYEDDEVTPLANPLTTDATGGFAFSIEAGEYDISVAITGYDAVVQDRVTIGSTGGGGGDPYVAINSAGALPITTTDAISIGGDVYNIGPRSVVIGATANNSSSDSTMVGYGNVSTSSGATAIGRSVSVGQLAVAVGYSVTASGSQAVSIGHLSTATANGATAVGVGADATAPHASAFGRDARATHDSSTAVGVAAQTTKANQVILGRASEEVFVPGRLVTTPLAVTVADSTSATLDLSLGDYFKMNATGNVAFTLTAPTPAVSDRVLAATLDLTKTTGTISYVTTILWDSGIAPDLSATGRYIIKFLSPDDGTTWLGFAAGSGMATV